VMYVIVLPAAEVVANRPVKRLVEDAGARRLGKKIKKH
jgi:hypothetical protein